MAEENKSSKGIGELFVEFGSKGTPDLLKSLNKVSAQFLLTKNAAEQFLKPISQLTKEASNSAVNINKISSILGTSQSNIQKLQFFLKKNNLSESIIDNIANTSNYFTDLHRNAIGIDGNFARALNLLGLNYRNYNGSYEDTIKFYDDVIQSMNSRNLDTSLQRAYIRDLKLPEELINANQQTRGFKMSEVFTISDKEIKNLVEMSQSANELTQTFQNLKNQKVGEFLSPLIIKGNKGTTRLLDGTSSQAEKVVAAADAIGGGIIGTIIGGLFGGIPGAIGGAATGAAVGTYGSGLKSEISKDIKKSDFGEWATDKNVNESYFKWKQKRNGQPTGGAAAIQELKDIIENPIGEYPKQINKPPSYEELKADMIKNNPEYAKKLAQEELAAINASASNIMNNYNRNINVYNDVSISGINAEDAQRQFIGITQETIRDAELSQFQMGNMPGL